MKVLKSIREVRDWRCSLRQGEQLVFVPTMGSLHEGHIRLIQRARESGPHVLISIFINPTQFDDPRDFERYPRDYDADLQLAEAAGCDACFLPSVDDIYPRGSQTKVTAGSLADYLCGATRLGHFDGVCTVVSLLFHITQCDVAVFGEKDYQQLAIIRQMVHDLHFPIEIIGVPTAREHDGLAISSRNVRLTPKEREIAPQLYLALQAALSLWTKGERRVEMLKQHISQHLSSELRLDYLELCDPTTLRPYTTLCHEDTLMAIACFLGDVRLIDHWIID